MWEARQAIGSGVNARSRPDDRPLVKPRAGVLIGLLALLLAAALALVFLGKTTPQMVGAFVLFALVAAVVTFGFLGARGSVRTKTQQVGGSAAVFVVVLGLLLPFAKVGEDTATVRGTVYVDGEPVQRAVVDLLETDARNDRETIDERSNGEFAFREIRGVGDRVKLRVTLEPSEKTVVTELPFTRGKRLVVQLSSSAFRTPSESPVGEVSPAPVVPTAIADCRAGASADAVLYLFDIQQAQLPEADWNEFLSNFEFKLDSDIRSHLESRDLLVGTRLEVLRCRGVGVAARADAVRFGRLLGSPAVLWGSAHPQERRLVVSLTSLLGPDAPVEIRRELPFQADLGEMLAPDHPVDDVYLAFSSFALAEQYRRKGQADIARRCFLHAQELAPPEPLRRQIAKALQALGPPAGTNFLAPVG